jgi:hypothetical protein
VVFGKTIVYIVVLILVSLDFWVCKNVIGRKLVRLRWWYTIHSVKGTEEWFYEHRYSKHHTVSSVFDLDEKVLAADNLVFWGVLWGHFIAWGCLCAMSVITF